MPVSLPPLNALRAFEVSARLQSFKKASDELFVTPSAISQQVKSLEDYLGIKLFERTPKGITPTAQGKKLLPALEKSFHDIAHAIQTLQTDSKSPFRVSAPPVFASSWLAPRLSEFEKNFSDLLVSVHSSLDAVSFDNGGFDCAIRLYPNRQNGDKVTAVNGVNRLFLFDTELFCVCNPNLLTNRKNEKSIPKTSQDLENFHLLHYRDYAPWTIWSRYYGEVKTLETTSGIVFHNIDALAQSLIDGQGIALIDKAMLEDPEFGKHLTPLFLDEIKYHIYFYLVARQDRWDSDEVSAFRDWLLSHVQKMDGYYGFDRSNSLFIR